MKRILSLIALAGMMVTASAANAAPVFMLQFGSFETKDEAQTKLDALKTKHAGVFSRMELGVREVTLPPDNLTVYRTQAGPLATRADAQSVCSQLASNGDECYVVETAMLAPTAPAATQMAAAEPAPAPVAAPVPIPAPKEEVAAPMGTVPGAAPDIASTKLSAAPAPQAMSAPMPMAVSASTSDAGRDPKNIAALNSVAPTSMMEQKVAEEEARKAADEMHRQLDEQSGKVVPPQPSPFTSSAVGVSPATTATHIAEEDSRQEATKDRSFWQRIFGSDEEPAQVAAAPAPAPVSAPVEPVIVATPAPMPLPSQAELTPQPAPESPPMMPPPQPLAAAPAPVAQPVSFATPASPMAPMPATNPVAQPVTVSTPIITQAEPFPLPPPPAPLVGRSLRPAPMVVAAPIAVAAQPNMPAPVIAPQPTGVVPSATNVRVEEAKRVPLSQANAPVMPSFNQPPMPNPASVPPALPPQMSPASTVGQKTLWAEVGSFASAQDALAYWDNYRRNHPDFPVVRVRVTTPLAAAQRGLAQVNLRVGPFGKQGFITNLCTSLVSDGLRCGSITDLGVASSRDTRRGFLPQSRYNR